MTDIHTPKGPSAITVFDTSTQSAAAVLMDAIRNTHDQHKVACGVVFLYLADQEQIAFFTTHITAQGALEICEAGLEQLRASADRMDAALKELDEKRGSDNPVQ